MDAIAITCLTKVNTRQYIIIMYYFVLKKYEIREFNVYLYLMAYSLILVIII